MRAAAAAVRWIMALISRGLQGLLLGLIFFYRYGISPYTAPSCRYYPSCSVYAQEALRRHGPLRGGLLSLWRLLRCHPFSRGGLDPVPERAAPAAPLKPSLSPSSPECGPICLEHGAAAELPIE